MARGRNHTIARSLALFFGVFGLMNTVGVALGHTANQNIWWINYSILTTLLGSPGSYVAVLLQVLTGVALLLWAVRPHASLWCRIATAALSAITALLALENAIVYWDALRSGELYAASPVPLSALIAGAFAFLTVIIMRVRRSETERGGLIGMTVGMCVLAFIFPLLQICFYGTTDYRRPADAAIVLGAQVHADGTLSTALSERMDTAISLYRQGYVPRLIVSGGTGTEGVNEAEAMRDYAVAAGVPADAVTVDSNGNSTEATVNDTVAILHDLGADDAIVTSSFYHMPRIKMMYLGAGVDVYTVPTFGDLLHNGTAKALWREIPGWWCYWVKDTLLT